MYALWFDHLWDNIPTVREDSAVALAQAVRAYGQEALDKIIPVLRCGRGRGQDGERPGWAEYLIGQSCCDATRRLVRVCFCLWVARCKDRHEGGW